MGDGWMWRSFDPFCLLCSQPQGYSWCLVGIFDYPPQKIWTMGSNLDLFSQILIIRIQIIKKLQCFLYHFDSIILQRLQVLILFTLNLYPLSIQFTLICILVFTIMYFFFLTNLLSLIITKDLEVNKMELSFTVTYIFQSTMYNRYSL